MTQCEKILEYMQEFGSITPLDALREFGCMRLASRMTDLKKAGVKFKKTMVKGRNRKGEAVRFAKYTLMEETTC